MKEEPKRGFRQYVTTSTYPVAEAEYSYWDFDWQIGLNYWLLWQ